MIFRDYFFFYIYDILMNFFFTEYSQNKVPNFDAIDRCRNARYNITARH